VGCVNTDTVSRWFDGELSIDERAGVQKHIDVCEDCRILFGELGRAALDASRDLPRSTAPRSFDGERGMEPHAPVTIGERIGRYVLLEWLGAGGMGVVFGAYDPELDRRVAVKLIGHDLHGDAQAEARLLREAQALARVSHPNVVTVYDAGLATAGESDALLPGPLPGQVFIAMEYLRGGTLAEWLREPHEWQAIVARFVEAGRGLAAAHAADLVHRDFKPGNVLFGTDGRARVTDFGLARLARDPHDANPAPAPGSWKGTPAYMSPEQRAGKFVDARSDQYSFCTALYEALFGALPSPAPQQPSRSSVPRRIWEALVRGLSERPADRFASMDALIETLARDRRSLFLRLGTAAAIVTCLALGGTAYLRAESRPARLCGGASRKLAGVWDSDRKQSIRSAFLATGTLYAKDSWGEVERTLDRYADQWTRMHTAACEATRIHGEQSEELMDLRISCLDGDARDLAALADQFVKADTKTVEKAVAATLSLPAIDTCADVATLRARSHPPSDPALRAEVLRVRGEISRAMAMERAGQYAAADQATRMQLDPAKATGDRSLEAEVELAIGTLRARLGDYAAGDAALYESVDAAEAAGDDVIKARALAELSWDLAEHENKLDEAARAGRLAASVLMHLPGEVGLRASVEVDLARVEVEDGHYAEADRKYEHALELREKTFGANDYRVAQSLNEASKALYLMGQFDKALSYQVRALAIRRQVLGPHHPSVATSLLNVALTETNLRRLDDALRDAIEALALWREELGDAHPNFVQGEGVVATILKDQGRSAEALPHAERSLALAETVFPGDHPLTINGMIVLGQIELKLGRASDAVAIHSRAKAMTERLSNPPDLDAEVCNDLGADYLSLGRAKDAAPLLEHALALRAGQATDPYELAETRLLLARALMSDGRVDRVRARELATQARDSFASHLGYNAERTEADRWLKSHP
jgi:serine/threonine protein kinase/tetratricopeptide (TPR) repeat protein